MIALLTSDQAVVVRTVVIVAFVVFVTIIVVTAVEQNHKQKVLKQQRLRKSEERIDRTSHLMAELDRIETDFLLKIEEYRRDFDDAS